MTTLSPLQLHLLRVVHENPGVSRLVWFSRAKAESTSKADYARQRLLDFGFVRLDPGTNVSYYITDEGKKACRG